MMARIVRCSFFITIATLVFAAPGDRWWQHVRYLADDKLEGRLKAGYEKGSPEETVAKMWLKERYHAPSDDVNQPVDKACASTFNAIVMELAKVVANRTERPKWKRTSFFRRFEWLDRG